MNTYRFLLTDHGAAVWRMDLSDRTGRQWRSYQTDIARLRAQAAGCDRVQIVGPGGELFLEVGVRAEQAHRAQA